jgi:hypothetical protein
MTADDRDLGWLLKDRFQKIGPDFYENAYFLPRAFMIGRAAAVADKKELLERVGQMDPKEIVFLPQLPAGYHPPQTSLFSAEEAKVLDYSPNSITIATRTREDKFLVLSDTYSPFWTAAIDRVPAPILRADYGVRALYVTKGAHRLIFSCHFYPFYYGLVITAVTALVFSILNYFLFRPKIRRETQEGHEKPF